MIEKTLLGVLSTPDEYRKYCGVIRREHVSKEVYRIITEGLEWWFDNYTDPVDWEKLSEYMMFSVLTGETEDSRKLYAQAMDAPSAAGAAGEAVVRTLNERLYFSGIAVMSQDIAEGLGTYDPEEVHKELEKFFSEIKGNSVPSMSARDILARMEKVAGAGLHWRLEELNVSIGDLRRGNLVLVAARTEAGKTTFLVDQTVDFLRQSDRPLLYLTNEDKDESIIHRYWQSGLDRTHVDVQKDLHKALADFEGVYGKDNLLVLDLHYHEINTWEEIQNVITQVKPSCVVIDQLRNVRGFSDSGTEIARLKELYSHARELANRVCPIIVAHQLDGSATGELYPQEHQLEGSRTEVQGTLDAQIMLGRSYQPGYEGVRGMNIVKNKLGNGPRASHAYRHGKFELRLHDDIQRYKGTL